MIVDTSRAFWMNFLKRVLLLLINVKKIIHDFHILDNTDDAYGNTQRYSNTKKK